MKVTEEYNVIYIYIFIYIYIYKIAEEFDKSSIRES